MSTGPGGDTTTVAGTATTDPQVGVVGDGTTTRSRATSRWRRLRVPLAIVAALVVIGLLAALPEPRRSALPLAPDNPQPGGARAVAQILGRHGVDVHLVRRFDDVLAADAPGVTVLVVGDRDLGDAQLDALPGLRSDLVLLEAPWAAEAVAGITSAWSGSTAGPRTAQCSDEDALAAGEIVSSGSLAAPPDATVCFPAVEGLPDEGTYVVTEADGRRVAALAGSDLLTNEHLATAGNAALALRVLGRTPELVWYIPSLDDPYGGPGSDEAALTSTMPPWVGPLAWQLLLVVVVAGVWRGRRLGPLVTEHLPVVVRAGEATRGRGRLYRRARAHGHAGAALRAAAATRCAARLGLPRAAAAPEVVTAIAHATGRREDAVEALLYGPPPADDRGLALLARDLDDLESEVHRP
ncbi:DUF4350 domain-containing protein [Cellulomonas sp. DKR-3]|uniref:DUF4350 domain-containing protein n=1 Tax=Cellulomonas fulva TaxID=2835530 RepID=A0ABS5TZQ2_9CELL|nr:DUF4350 domain-containing protein [Cellulomonas fulva]MBT0994638.1 DUF4350 domain-containing protein [Cellulomonas fulva]